MRAHAFVLSSILALVLAATGLAGCAGQVASPDDEAASSDNLTLLQPYLALGDSVAFGYNPVDAAAHPTEIWRFVGYPELIALAPIPTANASCEGETSSSFLDVTAPDNGCHAWRADGDAMHVAYASLSQSQMGYAVAYLGAHPRTKTVSIGIGANDLLLLQNQCTAEYYPDIDAINACIAADLGATPSPTYTRVAENLGAILYGLRATGYTGQIVVVTYYTTSYADPNDLNLRAIAGLDMALVTVAQKFGVDVAKGFSTFGAISQLTGGDACKAGLLYRMPDGSCDKHPSTLGHSVLAGLVAAAVPASSVNVADPSTF